MDCVRNIEKKFFFLPHRTWNLVEETDNKILPVKYPLSTQCIREVKLNLKIACLSICHMSRLILGVLFHIQPGNTSILAFFTHSMLGKREELGILHVKEIFSNTCCLPGLQRSIAYGPHHLEGTND